MIMKKVVFKLTILQDGTLATTQSVKENDSSGFCSHCRSRLFVRTSYVCLVCKDLYLCDRCKRLNVHSLHKVKSVLQIKPNEQFTEQDMNWNNRSVTEEGSKSETLTTEQLSTTSKEETSPLRNNYQDRGSTSPASQESTSADRIARAADRKNDEKIKSDDFQSVLDSSSSEYLVFGADSNLSSSAVPRNTKETPQCQESTGSTNLSRVLPHRTSCKDNNDPHSHLKTKLLICKVCDQNILKNDTSCSFCAFVVHSECCVVPRTGKFVCFLCVETRKFKMKENSKTLFDKNSDAIQNLRTDENGFLLRDRYSNEDAAENVLVSDLRDEDECQCFFKLNFQSSEFLLKNGSGLDLVGYEDGCEVKVINTCSFDSLFSLFLSAVRRNAFYRSLVKEHFEDSLFLDAIINFLESGDIDETYRRRAAMIKMCFPENTKVGNGHITYDCETTVDEMARRVIGMAHHFLRVCDNNLCPNKHKIIRQQLLPVTINEAVDMKTIQLQLTELLQKTITKSCGEKRMMNVELEDTCCEPCDGKATISPESMAPHFLLNLGQTFSEESFLGPPPIDRPVPVFLGDIPTLLDGGLSRQLPFRLQGCVEEVPGHYVAYLREDSDKWFIADDMKDQLEATDDYHIVYPRILLYTI